MDTWSKIHAQPWLANEYAGPSGELIQITSQARAGSTVPFLPSCFLEKMMTRTAMMTLLCLGLITGPASANGPLPQPKPKTVRVANSVDGAIVVTVNGSGATTLEPGASALFTVAMLNVASAKATVQATLVETKITATNSTMVQGQTAVATVTSPTPITLAITFSNSNTAKLSRESAMTLASSGGLVSFLLLGLLLGRAPRRQELLGETERDSELAPIS